MHAPLRTLPPVTTASSRLDGLPPPPASISAVQLITAEDVPVRLIAIKAVKVMLGFSDATIHAMVAAGKLPAPIKFGVSRRAAARWIEQEIVEFVAAKAAERGQPRAA